MPIENKSNFIDLARQCELRPKAVRTVTVRWTRIGAPFVISGGLAVRPCPGTALRHRQSAVSSNRGAVCYTALVFSRGDAHGPQQTRG